MRILVNTLFEQLQPVSVRAVVDSLDWSRTRSLKLVLVLQLLSPSFLFLHLSAYFFLLPQVLLLSLVFLLSLKPFLDLGLFLLSIHEVSVQLLLFAYVPLSVLSLFLLFLL